MMEHNTSTGTGTGQSQRPDHTASDLERELDRLSLTQALRDFEVANARVIDLTQRLIAATNDLVAVRQELDGLREAHEQLTTAHEQVRRSRAFKLASRIGRIRSVF